MRIDFVPLIEVNFSGNFSASIAPVNPINEFDINFVKVEASIQISNAPYLYVVHFKVLRNIIGVNQWLLNGIDFNESISLITNSVIEEKTALDYLTLVESLFDDLFVGPMRFVERWLDVWLLWFGDRHPNFSELCF